MDDLSLVRETTADLFANLIPLGLLGCGTITVLLNLANTGFVSAHGTMFSMAFVFGGATHAIVAVVLFLRGNEFKVIAFAGYGALRLSFAFLMNWTFGKEVWPIDKPFRA